MERGGEESWSEKVEDLVAAGDTQGAISFLENLISQLQTASSSDDLRLASALSDLASLYSSIGFSLKSDQLLSRASLLKHHAHSSSIGLKNKDLKGDSLTSSDVSLAENDNPLTHVCKDWEAIADREPSELLSSECLPGVSNLSLEDSKVEAPKRRGRGTFSYRKTELYSDRLSDVSASEDTGNEDVCKHPETKMMESKYGMHHVLVLADFSPSTRTTDLEKLFEDFRDRGVAIRWVNDTTALAVFRTPSIALEARNHVRCPFTIRILDKDDILLGSISAKDALLFETRHPLSDLSHKGIRGKDFDGGEMCVVHLSDLEPPRQRPQTSARTAQRLIAQAIGSKLPSNFGSRELRSQEEARRTRIVTRQKLRDDAWGDD
ncbi:coiled-coil domain-containing protein R3HCC1L-like [Gossypium australe]|uniref:Coiled-coil domain-containing protein R3HCC1L-like n=1 Tax=Gossypium australe TaxID=47621 RepID=A0A5B6UDS6_9ROSI|nr:coiled-coil domain-containing protein R3HCC1L-like [Gossypium australe]